MTTPQDPATAATIAAIRAFDAAIRRRDIEAMMALSTEDVVWETTTPPDGERYEGQEAARRGIEEFFRSSPEAVFEGDEDGPHAAPGGQREGGGVRAQHQSSSGSSTVVAERSASVMSQTRAPRRVV